MLSREFLAWFDTVNINVDDHVEDGVPQNGINNLYVVSPPRPTTVITTERYCSMTFLSEKKNPLSACIPGTPRNRSTVRAVDLNFLGVVSACKRHV